MRITIRLCVIFINLWIFPVLAKPAQPQAFDQAVFEQLDFGLYWFGDDMAYQKSEFNRDSPYFDPEAPTMIFVHGWEVGESKRQYREVFDYGFIGGPREYLAQAWLDDGWNVGVFYWNQFSDELMPHVSEAKVWSHKASGGMRWKDHEGKTHKEAPSKSASQLFFESYVAAMMSYRGDTVRIVGHSFGNQMAIVLGKKILDKVETGQLPPHLLPRRMALLDPAYMGGQRAFLGGKTTSEVALQYAQQLAAAGVVFEAYRTSQLMLFTPITDRAQPLMDLTAYTQLKFLFFPIVDFQKQHIASIWHYFWSYQFEPPTVDGVVGAGLSASASDERVLELMGGGKLTQIKGRWGKSPDNDEFTRVAQESGGQVD